MPPEAFRGLFALIIFNLRAQRNCKPCETLWRTWLIYMQRKWCNNGQVAISTWHLANWQSFDEMLTADLANC